MPHHQQDDSVFCILTIRTNGLHSNSRFYIGISVVYLLMTELLKSMVSSEQI